MLAFAPARVANENMQNENPARTMSSGPCSCKSVAAASIVAVEHTPHTGGKRDPDLSMAAHESRLEDKG